MNYQQLIKDLQYEVKGAVRFKQMGTAMRILTLIGLAPIFVCKWLLVIGYYILLFLYNALLSPANYLEGWQDARGKDVQHATQAVIFLVSTPFIFFCRILLSLASFFFYFLWFELMCANYLLTLGSIRWQPFLNAATFNKDEEHHWKLRPAETGTMVFGIVAFALFCVLTILFNIHVFGEVRELAEVTTVFYFLYYIVVLIVNPILFKKTEMTEAEINAAAQRNAYAQQGYYAQSYAQQGYAQQGYTQQGYAARQSNGYPNFNQASYARPMNNTFVQINPDNQPTQPPQAPAEGTASTGNEYNPQ